MRFDWRTRLASPAAPRMVLATALFFALPSLLGGLLLDDYIHQATLDGIIPGGPWHLFTFQSGNPDDIIPFIVRGPMPWWTWPGIKLAFIRPLTCALAIADHSLFGHAFLWHHVHSVLWYLALIVAVTKLFRRAFGAGLVAGLAALLFAIDDTHWMPVAWLANRNALVATVPTLFGLLAHLRWREDGWKPGLPLSVVGYVTGLAGGEAALGALAYLGAYELAGARDSVPQRVRALLPVAVLGVGYVILYRLLNAGAAGSGVYVDPTREPLEFLMSAPGRALGLIGAQLLAATADLWLLLQQLRPLLIAIGAAAVALMTWLMRGLWPTLADSERRALRWLALGSALSLVPVLATCPLNRLLLMPGLGAAGVVAVVLVHGLNRTDLLRWGARVLVVTNVFAVPLGWAGSYAVGLAGEQLITREAFDTKFSDEALSKRVVMFTAPDATGPLYVPLMRVWSGRPQSRAWLTFSYASHDHLLRRVSADTFELDVVNGRMMESVLEQLVRSLSIPLTLGQRFQLEGVELTIAAIEDGMPTMLRLRFTDPVDGGSYTFAKWEEGHLVPLELPAIGAQVALPWRPSMVSP